MRSPLLPEERPEQGRRSARPQAGTGPTSLRSPEPASGLVPSGNDPARGDEAFVAFDGEGPAYLTAGKPYRLTEDSAGTGFHVTDDDGDEIYCLMENCAHLNGGDWHKVEAPTPETSR